MSPPRATHRVLLAAAAALFVIVLLALRRSHEPPARTIPDDPTLDIRVDLNRADAIELVALPGIGPALAERILAERDRTGGFRELGDLARVSGIGERTIEELRDWVTVTPPGDKVAPEPVSRVD